MSTSIQFVKENSKTIFIFFENISGSRQEFKKIGSNLSSLHSTYIFYIIPIAITL